MIGALAAVEQNLAKIAGALVFMRRGLIIDFSLTILQVLSHIHIALR
jgi:hypothetical protein